MNIIVTGGASGLGLAITKLLLADGHFIFFTYNNSTEAAAELERENSMAKGFFCNYGDQKSVEAFVAQMDQINADVLVNNALAKLETKHFHKMAPTQFVDGFNNNILPIIQITQQAILGFRKRKFGKIINILSSYLMNKPPIGLSEYSAAKSYLYALHKSWVVENSNFNITSNCISPSFMQTALNSEVDSRVIESMIASLPLKKLLTPQEVADTVLFFVNCSQQINGQNLFINQGTDI